MSSGIPSPSRRPSARGEVARFSGLVWKGVVVLTLLSASATAQDSSIVPGRTPARIQQDSTLQRIGDSGARQALPLRVALVRPPRASTHNGGVEREVITQVRSGVTPFTDSSHRSVRPVVEQHVE